MTKVFLLLTTLFMSLMTFSQTPQGVVQTDNEQVNFWESKTAMIIGGILVLTLIITRTWSKRIHKKRDEVSKKNKEEKQKILVELELMKTI